MLKKALCLVFAFLLSINSFAAVVADNDGSAFITKAEFDSLKNNFQSQLDQFNTQIDNKIDSAISSYLAGVKVENVSTKNIINNKWKEVSNISGVLLNTYKVPSVNLDYFLDSHQRYLDTSAYDAASYWYLLDHYVKLLYEEDWSTINNCYRNLVTTTEDYPSVGRIIWKGQAVRYHESWNISRLIFHYSPLTTGTGDDTVKWSYLDRFATSDYEIEMRNLSSLTAVGYVNNWDDVKATGWPIGYLWRYSTTKGGTKNNLNVTFSSGIIHDTFVTSTNCDKDENGNAMRYEHIISYRTDDQWRLTNPDWNNLLNASPESDIKSSNLNAAATKVGSNCRIAGVAHHVAPQQAGAGDISVNYTITADNVIPSLGLFAGLRNANVIYQDNDEYDIAAGKIKVRKAAPKISDGFQLLAAQKEATIEWEPQFNYTHVHNSDSTYVDNAHEVDVYFSSEPFGTEVNTSKLIKVKANGSDTLADYATTIDRKAKVKFEMPSDSLVYVKWVPHDAGTYLSSDWIITLDVENCNSYKVSTKSD